MKDNSIKPDCWDKIAAFFRNFWHHLFGLAASVFGVVLSKPGAWGWAAVGLIGQFAHTVAREVRSGTLSTLRKRLAELEAQTSLTSETVPDFVKGYLVNLGDETLGFSEEVRPTRRLTLYCRGGDGKLYKVARYSRNPDWDKGRNFISADAGITAEAWRNHCAFENSLPDPVQDADAYVEAQVALGIARSDARALTMKARLYFAVRVQEKFASEPMAVLVFECTDPTAFSEDDLMQKLNTEKTEQYRTQIVQLVHRHFPDPAEAERLEY